MRPLSGRRVILASISVLLLTFAVLVVGLRIYLGREAENRLAEDEIIDFAARGSTGLANVFAACPPGYCTPSGDITSPVFAMDRERLRGYWSEVMSVQTRVGLVAWDGERHRATYIDHSAVFHFPDIVTVEFFPVGPYRSTLAILSRSRYGRSDFGVNARRVDFTDGTSLQYDYLMVATGAHHSYFGHDEWESAAPGLKKIEDLHIKTVTPEVKKKLSEYGKLYVKCAKGATYLSYTGQLTRSSWWSNETFRADGRVMIDVHSFKRVDNDQFTSEMRSTHLSGVRDGDNAVHKVVAYTPTENDLWRTFPCVYVFSFRAKRWGRMAIKGLSEIAWRSDSFDKLVLADDEKKLVRALVEHNDGSFSDLIEGKGGGCIFLLHGPPGQGKTLTAETIAELLKRPLYAISVGELGVTPDQLEERLRVILDVAKVWNAVILLDEADIYLEARDEHDITRNAMVGVFLRLLEYHHGVLFLTTNRVKNIDTAFYSRISVALHFTKKADDKREKIWNNLLDSAGITGIDVAQLIPLDINGRQIKNAIRLSQTLAKSENKKVDTAVLRRVIGLMTAFDRERSEASSI